MYSHPVWAIDFQFDQMMAGCILTFKKTEAEFSPLSLTLWVGRCYKVVDVIDSIEELFKQYPAPTHLRMENGPKFIDHPLQE